MLVNIDPGSEWMWACMRFFRPFLLIVTVLVCLACASRPAPRKFSEDIHQGIRFLNKATADYNRGCFRKALEYIQESHERFAIIDDLPGSADSLNTLANIYYRLGDIESALLVYNEAIALFEQVDQRTGETRALTNKAAALISAGKLDEASRALDHADELSKGSNNLDGLRLKTRALLRIARDDPQGAEDLLAIALRAASKSDRGLLADIHYTLAHVELTAQRPREAVSHLNTALKLDRAAGAYFSIGLDLAALGSCCEALADYAGAVGFYKRSLKIFALLQAHGKVQWVRSRLKASAGKAGLNPEAVLYWTDQWLSGRNQSDLCR
jgi:eukaryotic-like serine/threonine-protein kinase